MTGPIGLVSAILTGKMARSRWLLPTESQAIHAKKLIQHTPDTVRVEMMVALFHEYTVLPPSWSAKIRSVEAANNKTAPNQSTCRSDCQVTLGFLYAFSFCGQQTSIIAIPTPAAGALNR